MNYQLPGYSEVMDKLDAFLPEPYQASGETLTKKLERQNKLYIKKIDCPFARDGSHKAIVYTNGHIWAGLTECAVICGVDSDVCLHPNTHLEQVSEDYYDTPEHCRTITGTVNVCNDCELTVEGE